MSEKKKALIAMSGGVDSSVAAYLMKEDGYECMGVTMKLTDNTDGLINGESSCCSLDDVEDARSVAHRLGMPYYVFNFADDFKDKIMKHFAESYERGATPNPCIDCNRYMKFEKLYRRAEELGYDYVVTGHYATVEEKDARFLLKKAVDPSKDQSYVLYSLTQGQLSHTIFPLGTYHKTETRKIAEEQGFYNADKPDSQDICFVPDGDYASFIRRFTGKEYPCGNFVTRDGKVLGRHKGIIGYTLGKRKGLGISSEEPLYVTEIRPDKNEIVLGSNDDLFTREFDADNMNFIMEEYAKDGEFRAKVKVRYRQPEMPATVKVTDGRIHVTFDEAQRAITRGQAAVLYDGDYVIGGGTIL